jgi:hypothetical protein
MIKPEIMFDTECYPNYWLLRFKNGYSFELREGQRLTPEQGFRIRWLFDVVTAVSFNGRNYDVVMINAALCGYTPAQLKFLNDQIIVQGIKPWDINLPAKWEPLDHIDIIETCPGVKASLKQLAARVHSKRLQDLPYEPDTRLTEDEIKNVFDYCGNDLQLLQDVFDGLKSELKFRRALSQRYGIDLRSKSDAQIGETVLKLRCENVLGRKLYRQDVNINLRFKYEAPDFIAFTHPALIAAFEAVKSSIFTLNPNATVGMPAALEGLTITLGDTTYKMGIGGLHSQEQKLILVSDANKTVRMPDVASYYPALMINSGKFPAALGPAFTKEYTAIRDERLVHKATLARLKDAHQTDCIEYDDAKVGSEGGKIQINGPFGKTGSPYSILFAPEMLIQTTLTGQLSILMLIEWHEYYGIPVRSANTDGIVIECPNHLLTTSEMLIKEWEKRTGLEMETSDYVALYARDVNNYYAIKTPDDVKRKGEYALSGLAAKKNPDVEICSDAVEKYLVHGTPVRTTIAACRDIRKFVTIQKVAGGAVKLWGKGPDKNALVKDMVPVLEANGWLKVGRRWIKNLPDTFESVSMTAQEAYQTCFNPQVREYLGKVIRWYYGVNSPGTIVYAKNGNTVGRSEGAQPCMTLPDEFPSDIDYDWYAANCESILRDLGVLP